MAAFPMACAMSDALRVALVGATGLTGRAIIWQSVGRKDMCVIAVARREVRLPEGACIELVVADPHDWGEVLAYTKPNVLINALGTTWKKAGQDETAFCAIDQDLVLETARNAYRIGVRRMVSISSIGADPASKNFYLKVKGEVERDLAQIGFGRLDILRPGLLRGRRGNDRRFAERLGIIASPMMDIFLRGKLRRYRACRDTDLARAALGLAMCKGEGILVHEHDALLKAAGTLPIAAGS